VAAVSLASVTVPLPVKIGTKTTLVMAMEPCVTGDAPATLSGSAAVM
jgi:hypothetical protein